MEKQCNVSSHSSNSKFFYVMIYYNYDVTKTLLNLCKVFIHLDVYNKYKRRYMKDIKAMQYIEFDVVKFENSSTLRFILIRLRCCTRPLRSTHFFISIILITTNERIYIKNLKFINFDIFASKEILRNLDTLSLYKTYIISLVIIINDEKKYIKIYID